MLRELAIEKRNLFNKENYASMQELSKEEEKLHIESQQNEKYYAPIYNFDGLRTDPRIIHNHDFMRQPEFIEAYDRSIQASGFDSLYYWRTHVALWCASHAQKLNGDFVECGVWYGMLSSAIMNYLNWNSLNKHFYLFDTFCGIDDSQLTDNELKQGNISHFRKVYEENIYEKVCNNFKEFDRVHVIQGSVPSILETVYIDSVSYLSLDMNNVTPEIAAANYYWDKIVPGGIILLDDYGFVSYEEQKRQFDIFAKERDTIVLALPTGQGIIIKSTES